ncbi:HAMP domain-containing protein [bacterium]|nr:HAMP domain-containing protein [bacterium]
MTIRLRLTLLFALLLSIIGLVRIGAVVGGVSETLYRLARTDAEVRLQQVQNYLSDLHVERTQKGAMRLDLRSSEALIRAFSDDGLYVQIAGPDGRPLNKSPNLGNQQFPLPPVAGFREIDLPLPHLFYSPRILLVTRPLLLAGKQVGWIQVGYPLEEIKRTLHEFRTYELAGWAFALLLALGVGYLFAGRVLAPVSAITDEVNSWMPTDIHRRLPVGGARRDELGKLTQTFNRLFDRLQASFEMERRFVADASHELKSPLTAIRGHLQLIQRLGAARPEECERWAGTAIAEVDRLSRLVNDLLVLARTDEGLHAADFAPLDLGQLLKGIADHYEPLFPRLAVRAPIPELWVVGSDDRLRQVLVNLIDNALRATQQGGEVRLSLESEADEAILRVADAGVGIAPEAIAKLFDRFYRVDDARSRDSGGSGLGLAITSAIVTTHGGTIQVASEVGRGTTFTVRLPLSKHSLSKLSASERVS